jgi:hypothetical protein
MNTLRALGDAHRPGVVGDVAYGEGAPFDGLDSNVLPHFHDDFLVCRRRSFT